MDEDGGVVLVANAWSKWAGKSLMETESLFSQQFMLQQRMEDLCQEMITVLCVQRSYLQNMSTSVKRLLLNLLFTHIPHRGGPLDTRMAQQTWKQQGQRWRRQGVV